MHTGAHVRYQKEFCHLGRKIFEWDDKARNLDLLPDELLKVLAHLTGRVVELLQDVPEDLGWIVEHST